MFKVFEFSRQLLKGILLSIFRYKFKDVSVFYLVINGILFMVYYQYIVLWGSLEMCTKLNAVFPSSSRNNDIMSKRVTFMRVMSEIRCEMNARRKWWITYTLYLLGDVIKVTMSRSSSKATVLENHQKKCWKMRLLCLLPRVFWWYNLRPKV